MWRPTHTAAKYLYKFVTKGSDYALVSVVDYDEVKNFHNMQSIGASKACWRLFITYRYPAVMALGIHLEGEVYVIFNEVEEQTIIDLGWRKTELTLFFTFNQAHS